MAPEETADLLRSARLKILQNSIFRQNQKTEIEFCKNFGRVLPLQGLAAKAGGRLYERHKNGNGSGQLKVGQTELATRSSASGFRLRTLNAIFAMPVSIMPLARALQP